LKTEYRYRKIYLNPVFSFTQYYGHCRKLYEWCKENNIPTNIKNNQSTKNTVGLYLYNPISAIAG
jgi:hypothetical protein